MAQFVYTGLQGHGKSYEVVKSVIVPNLAKGRRVVTNVAGLQKEKIQAYIKEHFLTEPEKQGQIVFVDHDIVSAPDFFPKEESENPYLPERREFSRILQSLSGDALQSFKADLEEKAEAWRNQFIVKPGDVVVLDECWRFYSVGEELPEGHLKFFRMHRHFIDPVSGQCCDLVLIVQSIDDLRRNIRATVEKSFLMQKHVDLGLPNHYVVSVYGGNRQSKSAFIEDFQRKYDPAIFELYSSHSQKKEGSAGPKEERVDSRGNLFNRPLFKYVIPIGIVWLCFAVYFVWGFFHPKPKESPSLVGSVVPASVPSPGASSPAASSAPKSPVSSKWRLVGTYSRGGEPVFVMADSQGAIRSVSSVPRVKYSPGEIEVALPDLDVVTFWSGSREDRK